MVRNIMRGLTFDGENIAWEVLTETQPGDHFLASEHTLKHCRESFMPHNFIRLTREAWEREGSKNLMDRVRDRYNDYIKKENTSLLPKDMANQIDSILKAVDKNLGHG
jgi:trimethylamine--corrinoid protein Co-methyltransferase